MQGLPHSSRWSDAACDAPAVAATCRLLATAFCLSAQGDAQVAQQEAGAGAAGDATSVALRSALAFSTDAAALCWTFVEHCVGWQNAIKVRRRGGRHACVRHAQCDAQRASGAEVHPDNAACTALLVMCVALRHLLHVMDEGELYEQQRPLALSQVRVAPRVCPYVRTAAP